MNFPQHFLSEIHGKDFRKGSGMVWLSLPSGMLCLLRIACGELKMETDYESEAEEAARTEDGYLIFRNMS